MARKPIDRKRLTRTQRLFLQRCSEGAKLPRSASEAGMAERLCDVGLMTRDFHGYSATDAGKKALANADE